MHPPSWARRARSSAHFQVRSQPGTLSWAPQCPGFIIFLGICKVRRQRAPARTPCSFQAIIWVVSRPCSGIQMTQSQSRLGTRRWSYRRSFGTNLRSVHAPLQCLMPSWRIAASCCCSASPQSRCTASLDPGSDKSQPCRRLLVGRMYYLVWQH